jgi:AcrR family transcriptional regulator
VGGKMADFTKKAIMETFLSLLDEKELDKITVKEITTKCHINRNTFYYHFIDIYDLLNQILKLESSKVIESCNNEEISNQKFIESIKFAAKNKNALFHIYNSNNKEELKKCTQEIVTELLRYYLKKNCSNIELLEEDKEIIIKFYTGAIIYLIMDWFSNGMKNEPLEFIQKIVDLISSSITGTVNKYRQN